MYNDILLVGNPNCGKTTLFNLLTGRTERVGNRAGVTVESKSGKYIKNKRVVITDLPGAYSFKSKSPDEKVAAEHALNAYGAIVNVIDGTDPERALRLTYELCFLRRPMVIAVNFSDELKKNGIEIDCKRLSEAFGVPVVLISARKNKNITALVKAATETATVPILPDKSTDEFVKSAVQKAVKTHCVSKRFTDKADSVLMNKYAGIPIFAVVITAVYYFTYTIGGFFGDKTAALIARAGASAAKSLTASGTNAWFIDFIKNALFGGVGSVLSFLPQILVLFFLLAVIEESGYLARAAFLLDGLMEKAGLGGKSLVALGVSCGCTVGGIMTTRTIEDIQQRRLTTVLTPFMPCGAKTAVFAWFSGLLFGGNPFITASLYFLSVLSVATFGAMLKRLKLFKSDGGLLMEIPVLRIPSAKGVWGALKEKTGDFILKTGSVIFSVSAAVWFLKSFGINGYTTNVSESFLFYIGDGLKYLFVPLGFGSWQASVAVISGIFAKEAVIQTLTVVSATPAALFSSPYSAYAFISFILLMPPCVAALSAAANELKNAKIFLFMIVFQTVAAYSVALAISLLGLFTARTGAPLWLTIAAIGAIITAIMILKKRGCGCRCRSTCGGEICAKCKKANTTL